MRVCATCFCLALVAGGAEAQAKLGPPCFMAGTFKSYIRDMKSSGYLLRIPGQPNDVEVLMSSADYPTLINFNDKSVVVLAQRQTVDGQESGIVVRQIVEPRGLPPGVKVGLGCLTDLPAGRFGGGDAFATGISDDGKVVVGYDSGVIGDSSQPTGHGWKYAAGAIADLGTLGGPMSQALAISADGSTIVGTAQERWTGPGDHGPWRGVAFRYVNGKMERLGLLNDDDNGSEANGVSGDGAIIVGRSGPSAFLYRGGAMTRIDHASVAWSVSGDGRVIVGDGDNDDPFRYENGALTDLGSLGGKSATARFVSYDGSVIFGNGLLRNRTLPIPFESSGGRIIGDPKWETFWPVAISRDMSTKVESKGPLAIRSVGGELYTLGALGIGPAFANVELTAVSGDGKRIVGSYAPANEHRRAFLFEVTQ